MPHEGERGAPPAARPDTPRGPAVVSCAARTRARRCAFCHDDLGAARVDCPACRSSLHLGCARAPCATCGAALSRPIELAPRRRRWRGEARRVALALVWGALAAPLLVVAPAWIGQRASGQAPGSALEVRFMPRAALDLRAAPPPCPELEEPRPEGTELGCGGDWFIPPGSWEDPLAAADRLRTPLGLAPRRRASGLPPDVRAALLALQARQAPDGRWSRGRGDDVLVTAIAVHALLHAGQTPRRGAFGAATYRGLRWLVRQQRPDGRLDDDPLAHAIATAALAEASALEPDVGLWRPLVAARAAIERGPTADHVLRSWRYLAFEQAYRCLPAAVEESWGDFDDAATCVVDDMKLLVLGCARARSGVARCPHAIEFPDAPLPDDACALALVAARRAGPYADCFATCLRGDWQRRLTGGAGSANH